MFITICYLYLGWAIRRRELRDDMAWLQLVQRHLARGSIVFRSQTLQQAVSRSSFLGADVDGRASEQTLVRQGSRSVLLLTPEQQVNIDTWTLFLDRDLPVRVPVSRHKTLVLVEARQRPLVADRVTASVGTKQGKMLKLSDSAAPLAWQGGDPYGLLIELSISELSSLGQAFMRGCLMLEEELEVVRMMSVSFTGQPQQLLHDSQLCSAPASRRLHLCRRTAETTMAPPSAPPTLPRKSAAARDSASLAPHPRHGRRSTAGARSPRAADPATPDPWSLPRVASVARKVSQILADFRRRTSGDEVNGGAPSRPVSAHDSETMHQGTDSSRYCAPNSSMYFVDSELDFAIAWGRHTDSDSDRGDGTPRFQLSSAPSSRASLVTAAPSRGISETNLATLISRKLEPPLPPASDEPTGHQGEPADDGEFALRDVGGVTVAEFLGGCEERRVDKTTLINELLNEVVLGDSPQGAPPDIVQRCGVQGAPPSGTLSPVPECRESPFRHGEPQSPLAAARTSESEPHSRGAPWERANDGGAPDSPHRAALRAMHCQVSLHDEPPAASPGGVDEETAVPAGGAGEASMSRGSSRKTLSSDSTQSSGDVSLRIEDLIVQQTACHLVALTEVSDFSGESYEGGQEMAARRPGAGEAAGGGGRRGAGGRGRHRGAIADTDSSTESRSTETASLASPDAGAPLWGNEETNRDAGALLREDDVVAALPDVISSARSNVTDASTKGGTSVAPAGAPYRAPSTAPNVLVYTGAGEDSARRYQLARGALSLCLNPDSYAIYRLTSEQALGAPWVGGATLLLVSCDHLQPGVEETMMRYFATGGRLLSVCSPLDQRFVGVQPMRKTQRRRRVVVTATTPAGCDARLLSQGRWYDTRDVLMPSLSVEAVVADKDTQHTLVAEVRSTETGGCAMLSQVRLDMEPAEAGVSEDMFTSLKQANSARIDTVRHLLERMGMDCTPHEQPCLTPAYLYTKSEAVKQRLLSALNPSLVNGVLQSKVVSLRFTSDPTVTSDLTATSDTVTSPDVAVTPDLLPVIHRDHTVIPSNGNCSVFHKERGGGGGRHGDATTWAFDEVAYFKSLDTEVLGQAVMFCEVVPTTMTLFDRLMFVTPADTGVVAIARQQTAGRGRSGNAWISPRGCAMFSAVVRVPLMSVLGKRTPFLQHLTALAIVEAVRSEPGYEDIDLRLKWPNDIYYGQHIKLGGVIVNSTFMGSDMYCVVGCGVNVSNSSPTCCINDLIRQHNSVRGGALCELSMEQVIARSFTQLERLVRRFDEDASAVKQLYYDRWLHSGSTVTLADHGLQQVTVEGLDEYGYLVVRTRLGDTISVQPDGNSFDMLHRVISVKPSR